MSNRSNAATITAYPDGPLLVRGEIELRTPEGEIIRPHRRTVALCRCGLSVIKPFCDGTHKAAGFRTEGDGPAADTDRASGREDDRQPPHRERVASVTSADPTKERS